MSQDEQKAQMAAAKEEKPQKPQCHNKTFRGGKGNHRCRNDGNWCWVSGTMGREAKVLCNPCIDELRQAGWTVRYQIEGDNPPPLGGER